MHSIVVRPNYITCGFKDGDNKNACTVQNNEYLSIRAYTRDIEATVGMYPDIIDLVKFVLGLRNSYEAMNEILKILGLQTGIINKVERVKDGTELFRKVSNKKSDLHANWYDISILDNYDKKPHIDLLTKDWILPEYAQMYNVVFDEESNRIIFPHFHYADKTKILALVGRTVNPAFKELKIPKYLTLVGVGYKKENNIYGLSHNMKYIKEEKKVIIFEAEKSVIKAHQVGYPYSVSIGCHDISMQQAKILLSLGVEEIILAFDKDVKLEHIKKYVDLFSSFVKVTIIYDAYDILDDKESPIDKGMKRFGILYRNRKSWSEWKKIVDEKKFVKI